MDYSTFDTHTQHTCLMFNECLIHLFNYTWLNVLCLSNIMFDQTQKYFKVFWLFLEVIFVLKNLQKSKNLSLCIFATHSRVMLSGELSRENTESFEHWTSFWQLYHDSLASGHMSRKKNLENFSKFSEKLIFRCSTWGYRDSLASGHVSRKKDFDNFFFKIFLKMVLGTHVVTHSLLTWVAKIACFAKIRLKLSSFSKLFIFPRTLLQSLCLFRLPFTQNHNFLPKTSTNLLNLSPNSRKGMGFHSISLYFMVYIFYFMDLMV